jgi:hypothetical protein
MRRPLSLGRLTTFRHPASGELCQLDEPDGPATTRQLWRLNRLGALVVVEPDGRPISKAEASFAIDRLSEEPAA